ncbi:MAG TPA: EH signature domain-containing protein [Ideonella sp.]|nr:EH signature domain-containing protein [Ideonella sp.]
MTALDDLAALLQAPAWEPPAPARCEALADVIAGLERRVQAGSGAPVAAELQRSAVQRFWADPRLHSLKDARQVCFGLALAPAPQAPRLIEDARRLAALLAQVDRWREQPRHFRRAYQGLLHSYFGYDAKAPSASPAGRSNWEQLRRYLDERCRHTVAATHNPDWVPLLLRSRHLFGEQPGLPYAPALLNGDLSAVTALREQLGIGAGSWFLRELVQAQLTAAVALADEAFTARIAALLALLAQHALLRDTGLQALLNRCAGLPPDAPPHDGLLQVALRSWGDPAAAEPDPRWGSVNAAARTMFAGWLTRARIAAFFLQLGDGSAPMRRRAAFWQRYAPAVQALRFGLDPRALPPPGGPLAALLRPLGGRVLALAPEAGQPMRHALVMTLGPATLVEFSGVDDALQLHDSAALPAEWRAPLRGASLQAPGRLPPLPHADGQQGWLTWEAWFEATLKQQFELRPGAAAPATAVKHVDLSESLAPAAAAPPPAPPSAPDGPAAEPGADAHWRTAEAAHIPYSRADLEVFARAHGLPVRDRSAEGGGLWVLSRQPDANVGHVLARWGFAEVPGTGWRR